MTVEPKTSLAPTTTLAVTGMTCSNCARHVTEAIQSMPGVRSANVNLDVRQATIRWTSSETNVSAVIRAVEQAGYGAKIFQAAHEHGGHKLAGWQLNLWVGVLGTAPLMIGEWVFDFGMQNWFRWLAFALATMVQIFAGARFYRGAWRQLKARNSNMDTLVALGSTAAFLFSAWILVRGTGGHLYFMEAAAIITLISVGHWLESSASSQASTALRKLLNLAPALARRRNPNGGEIEIPASELKPNDLVILRPGDCVPVDGVVIEGNSVVDETMLTGESMPVDKKSGGAVYTGTVNLNGQLVIRVTATGEATALANIITAVQRAQTSRADIQRLGDRVSSVFVPVVVFVAIATALGWSLMPDSLYRLHNWLAQFLWAAHPPENPLAAAIIGAVAVLIVACPCAMGLATPAAIMAGSNAAAQRGILIRDGVALEKAGRITAIIFDKTGTLTEGKPKAVASQLFPIEMPVELQSFKIEVLAASLASLSNHPLSRSIAELISMRSQLKEFKEFSGRGVAALFELGMESNHFLQLGSLRWLKEEKVDVGNIDLKNRFADDWMNKGASVIGFAVNCRLVAIFALLDIPKPNAGNVIQRLGDHYIDDLGVYILSGDSKQTVDAIAEMLGIYNCNRWGVFSEVRPEQKAEFIKKLQAQGERVAFVGDGINDAPALEQADLGIAVSRASDIAREAADIILLNSEIEAVPEALSLARATLRTIKQNLFWAFFYNAAAVPLAALGFMSPVLCATTMGLSDLVVIGNALRLRRWKNKN